MMLRLLRLCAAAAVLLGLTVPAGPAAASGFNCADVFQMFARGSGRDVGRSPEARAFFREVRREVGAGLVVASREVGASAYDGHRYPAVGGVLNLLEGEFSWMSRFGGEYRASVAAGRAEAAAYLNDRARACPGERWVLGGYSQGAHVIGEALFDLTRAAKSRIAFVALFGDPKLDVNGLGSFPGACFGDTKPWRRGSIRCVAPGGILDSRHPYVPASLEHRVGSWCDRNDGACTGNQITVLWDQHAEYPYDEIPAAAREIAGRLRG